LGLDIYDLSLDIYDREISFHSAVKLNKIEAFDFGIDQKINQSIDEQRLSI